MSLMDRLNVAKKNAEELKEEKAAREAKERADAEVKKETF